MKHMKKILLCLLVFTLVTRVYAVKKTADSSNYKTFISALSAGDTLVLTKGTYTGDLQINGMNGSAGNPIVITGDKNGVTRFVARSCCNTVSLANCSYLVIQNLLIDGNGEFVDAVKAEGYTNNNVHHITLQYLKIIGYNSNQQSVGISTKCHAWNWVIRKNIIEGVGTGLYLGNSNGDAPFVNGLIEYNLVKNTIGYNMEIKHQMDTVRKKFAGTNVDGKTIIRYNVFTKETGASTGADARPCVLLGAFPGSGFGSNDRYEVYGNFFYQNPVETMIQITGNTALYNNIFVNHSDGGGMRAIYVTSQNGFKPRDIKIFHNTVWAANSAGGIRLFDPNTAYKQYCYGNVVFAANAITNFTDTLHNVTGTYSNAAAYFNAANTNISLLDLYPKNSVLQGPITANSLFTSFTDYNKDFNNAAYDWTWRGAYSGSGTNKGWKLKIDTIPFPVNILNSYLNIEKNKLKIFPNPSTEYVFIPVEIQNETITITSINGACVLEEKFIKGINKINVSKLKNGDYLISRKSNPFSTERLIILR
jgi:Secretion system C-terminal sorting domain